MWDFHFRISVIECTSLKKPTRYFDCLQSRNGSAGVSGWHAGFPFSLPPPTLHPGGGAPAAAPPNGVAVLEIPEARPEARDPTR